MIQTKYSYQGRPGYYNEQVIVQPGSFKINYRGWNIKQYFCITRQGKILLMIKISVFHNTNGYKHKVLNRFIAKFWQECLHEWNDSKKECITVDKTMDIDIEWDVTFEMKT